MKEVCLMALRIMVLGIFSLFPLPGISQIGDPYAEAVRYFDLGRYERAATRLQGLLRNDPLCVECYDLLARIATSEGQDSLAAEWYRLALEVEPENAALFQKLGIAEHRLREYEQAILDLTHSLDLNSANGESHFALGNIWYDLDSLKLAKQGYYRAIALDSTAAKYHFQLALVYYETDEPDSALTEFQRAYRWYPKSTQAYELAATILIDQGRWRDVVAVLESGLASAPETPNTRYWLGGAYVEVGDFQRAANILGGYVIRYPSHVGGQYNYGIALYEIGEYEKAVTYLSAVQEQKPDLLKAQLYLGRALGAQDQDSLAFVVFDSLLIRDPNYYEVWINRGDIHLRRGRYRQAIEQYQRAGAIDLWRWEALHRQGLSEYYQGHYAQAEQSLILAWSRDDSIATVYDALGDVAAAMGEDDFSIYYYGRVLRMEPENDDVRTKLVDAFIRQRLWSFARGQLLRFHEQGMQNETVLYRLARVTQAAGDTTSARGYFEQFMATHRLRRERERLELRLRIDSRNPRHSRELGFFYRKQGDDGQARDYFRKAVALGDTTLSVSDYFEDVGGP